MLPESYGEAHSQEVEKGRIECKQGGVKEDIREAASELVQRPIQDGVPDSEIHRYAQWSLKEIGRFRNGSSGTADFSGFGTIWLASESFPSGIAGLVIPALSSSKIIEYR